MRSLIRVRPSRPVSRLGAVIGFASVLLGLLLLIPAFGAFGLAWTVLAGAVTLACADHAARGRGRAARPAGPRPRGDSAGRLLRLTRLKEAGLLSEQEYQQKRQEILARPW